MRTTLSIDEDILQAAKSLAAAERQSLGRVISDLARRGLAPRADRIGSEDGFPVFRVDADAPAITPDMVSAALDEP
ncbi:MAG: antitoxin [Actinobacteria bacterium]|nr:antitoxin [Actinomycetota bacterium]MBO0830798.1 antitoxin [Actinomycetota bacterium]MBO0834962.1 antitoxin [Actinomycetota bacterium]